MLKYLFFALSICLAAPKTSETTRHRDFTICSPKVIKLDTKERNFIAKSLTITPRGSLTIENPKKFQDAKVTFEVSGNVVINGAIEARGVNLTLISKSIMLINTNIACKTFTATPVNDGDIIVKGSEIAAKTINLGSIKSPAIILDIDASSKLYSTTTYGKINIFGIDAVVSGTIIAPCGKILVYGRNEFKLQNNFISTKAQDSTENYGYLTIVSAQDIHIESFLPEGSVIQLDKTAHLYTKTSAGYEISCLDFLRFLEHNHVNIDCLNNLYVNCDIPALSCETILSLSSFKTTINSVIDYGRFKLKGIKKQIHELSPVIINPLFPGALKSKELLLEQVDLTGACITLTETNRLKIKHAKLSLYELGSVTSIANEGSIITLKRAPLYKDYEYILVGTPALPHLDVLVQNATKLKFFKYTMNTEASRYLVLQRVTDLYAYSSSIKIVINSMLLKGVNISSIIKVKVSKSFFVANYEFVGMGKYSCECDDLIKFSKTLVLKDINPEHCPYLPTLNLKLVQDLTVIKSVIKVHSVDSLVKAKNQSSKIFATGIGLSAPDLVDYSIHLADPSLDALLPLSEKVEMHQAYTAFGNSVKLLKTLVLACIDSRINLHDTGKLVFVKNNNCELSVETIASEYRLKEYQVFNKISSSDPLLRCCRALALFDVNLEEGECLDLQFTKALMLKDSKASIRISSGLKNVCRNNSTLYVTNFAPSFTLFKYSIVNARDLHTDNLLLKSTNICFSESIVPSGELLNLPKARKILAENSEIRLKRNPRHHILTRGLSSIKHCRVGS